MQQHAIHYVHVQGFSLLLMSSLPDYGSASSSCLFSAIVKMQSFSKRPPGLCCKLVSFFPPSCVFVLFYSLSLFLPSFPASANTHPFLPPTAGQINSVPGSDMRGGSRPSVSSLSPSPGRVGKMTGRGVGMKALSGHQVYLASAINPLTAKAGGRHVCCCSSKI